MKTSIKILYIWLFLTGTFYGVSQNVKKQQYLELFTDRDFCISGDTVWFKVWVPKNVENTGNIIRVQLDSKSNNLISEVAVKSKNSWAQGFLFVPDSLSTGQYFITAFLNNQRNISDLELESRSLLVYNRFAENISQIEIIPPNSRKQQIVENTELSVITDKETYRTREKVGFKIVNNKEFDFSGVLVKAAIVDPLATEIKGKYKFGMQSSGANIPDYIENNGVLINGKVTDMNGNAPSDALVTLSLDGVQPYFDYYFLGENGDFHFFIKNAIGNSNVVLQVISRNQNQYFIQLENSCLVRKDSIQGEVKLLKQEQIDFVKTAVDANFTHKLFYPVNVAKPDGFTFPARFPSPFYGEPTLHVVPDEFIDLPDFQEISRELLPGVQYRLKNEEITIRIINNSYRMFFQDEPLRLINGIPVFDNELFARLKSTDINYIDIVKNERIFGDVIFKGVLAVSLYDKSNSWLIQQPNVFQFSIDFIQPEKKPGYLVENSLTENQPDMRQVFLWKVLKQGIPDEIEFILSDRKGIVEITVKGFTADNEYFKTSKRIEVK